MCADVDRRRVAAGLVFLVVLLATPCLSYIDFHHGYSYQYQYNSTVTLLGAGDFILQAKLGYQSVGNYGDHFELVMTVEDYHFFSISNHDMYDNSLDFSNWFSFDIKHHGEITGIYYTESEDEEVLAFKKGFASLISGKLLTQIEADGELKDGQLSYVTEEIGHEGPHRGHYTITPTNTGKRIHKKRIGFEHETLNLDTHSEKTMHIDDELGTLKRVNIDEKVTSLHSSKPGFDPHYAMRPAEPANQFEHTDIPSMTALTKGELFFLSRTKTLKYPIKPEGLAIGSLRHDATKFSDRRHLEISDIGLAAEYIESNLSCIRKQPKDIASKEFVDCFYRLMTTLKALNQSNLKTLVDVYFGSTTASGSRVLEQELMVDALVTVDTNMSRSMVLNIVLKDVKKENLLKRLMFHMSTMETEPEMRFSQFLQQLCVNETLYSTLGLSNDVLHSIYLALGSLANKHRTIGDNVNADSILACLHEKLGLHDPWAYRQKRNLLSEEEQLEQDINKVVLLESLGNGRDDSSFEYIVSHVNSSNSPWVKRAGVHALRHFQSVNALDVIMAAEKEDNNEVRYEASLQYQAHPLAHASRHGLNRPAKFDNSTSTPVQEESVAMYPQVHSRKRRSIFDNELKFSLKAPDVNFQKKLGTSSIGASFGAVMLNYFDMKMSLSSGWMKVEVHDEVYARVHLGFVGINIDFFSARVCFKGGVDYDVNTILEYNPLRKAKQFTKIAKDMKAVYENVAVGIKRLDSVIRGAPESFEEIADKFLAALRDLPKKVLILKTTAMDVMDKIGKIAVDKLPDFMIPVEKVTSYLVNLYGAIKSDVMDFYNHQVQLIETRLPRALEQLLTAVEGIFNALGQIFKDPKTTVARIGKGVISIRFSLKELVTIRDEVIAALFPDEGKRPYWMDIGNIVAEVTDMLREAKHAILTEGVAWVQDTVTAEDPIKALTDGNFTKKDIKDLIIADIESIVQELWEPIEMIQDLGMSYIQEFKDFFGITKSIKEAYGLLKRGYQLARTLLKTIFGPKVPTDFSNRIRLSDDTCAGHGFYPSKLYNGESEYEYNGVDVDSDQGSEVVAPFSGIAILSPNDKEVMLENVQELPDGMNAIISNLYPVDDIYGRDDPMRIEKQVSAGDVIGHTAESPCSGQSHIHLAVTKDGGTVDPTPYLPPREPKMPEWKQRCSDYRIIYKGQTIKVGKLGESTAEDTSNRLEPLDDIGDLSSRKKRTTRSKPDDKLHERKRRDISNLSNNFRALMERTEAYLQQFSVSRMKFGEILNFLTEMNFDDSKQKLLELFKTVKDVIDNEKCKPPQQMSTNELFVQLVKRGRNLDGNRKDMIATLQDPDKRCPLLALALSNNKGVYCSFDDMCLGMQCCVTLELGNLLRMSFKAMVKYDPTEMSLTLAFGKWNRTIHFKESFEDISETVGTGIAFDIIGIEVTLGFEIQKTDKAIRISAGLGLSTSDRIMWKFVEDAFLSIPQQNQDGTFSFPAVNFKDYFNTKSVKERLLEAGQNTLEKSKGDLVKQLIDAIGIDEEYLQTATCVMPEEMSEENIKQILSQRHISTNGTRGDLNERYRFYDRTCTTAISSQLTLPDLAMDSLKELVYFSVSRDCLRFDVCANVRVPDIDISMSVNAYLSIEPCNFTIHAGFEKFNRTLYLLGYDFGKEAFVKLTEFLFIRFTIDKNVRENLYIVSLGIRFISNEAIDVAFVDQMQIPIPLCNEDFTLPGKGDLLSLASALGGQLTTRAFRLFLQKTGIDGLFNAKCDKPAQSNDCTLDVNQYISNALRNIAVCEMVDRCLGISCCLDFSFNIPLASQQQMNASIGVRFEMNTCANSVEVVFGPYTVNESLAYYEWGDWKTWHFGYDRDPIVTLMYNIQEYDRKGFSVNLNVSICLPVGNDKYCVPNSGLQLLENKWFAACNLSAEKEQGILPDFSLSDWLEDLPAMSSGGVGQAGLDYLFERLDLTEYMHSRSSSCDRTRNPYSPSHNGWKIDCRAQVANLPSLPNFITCHIAEDCAEVQCCVDIDVLGLSVSFSLRMDFCSNIIVVGIEKLQEQIGDALSNYVWGTSKAVSLKSVFQMSNKIERPDQQTYTVDLQIAICFDTDGSCLVNTTIMAGSAIPRQICQLVNENCIKEVEHANHHCIMDDDCLGLVCNVENVGKDGTPISMKLRLNECTDRLINWLGDQKWTHVLSTLMRGKSYAFGDLDEQMTLTIDETAVAFSISINISSCSVSEDASTCKTEEILREIKFYKRKCDGTLSRKRRQTEGATTVLDRLRNLLTLGAPDIAYHNLFDIVKEEEVEKLKALTQSTDVGSSDNRCSFISLTKALGRKSPLTLPFLPEDIERQIAKVEGAAVIADYLGKHNASINALFEIGKGLTSMGVQQLSEMLADMRIGDLDALLDMMNVDPKVIHEITAELIDLANNLMSEMIDEVLSGTLKNAFESFDVTIRAAIPFPRQPVYLFQYTYVFMVGPVPVLLEYGAGGAYDVQISTGFQVLNMVAEISARPSAALSVWGAASVGAVLYARLELVGYIMDLSFPTKAELGFSKLPLKVGLKMDLNLVPLRLELNGLLTIRIRIPFCCKIRKVLFKASIWRYQAPKIAKNIFCLTSNAEDDSPPVIEDPFIPEDGDPIIGNKTCSVKQLSGRDYTWPGFEISFSAKDSLSQLRYFMDIGTIPGGTDVVEQRELTGTTNKLYEKLSATGVPLYFTVFAENSGGMRSSATCQLETFDVTLPTGRLEAAFATTSNPSKLKAYAVIHDDSRLDDVTMSAGFGRGKYGDQISGWREVSYDKRKTSDTTGDGQVLSDALEYFTERRNGRLIGGVFKTIDNVDTMATCARHCLDWPPEKCLSFNYDFGLTFSCELLEAIQGHDFTLATVELFSHYERLGIGHSVTLLVDQVTLKHNFLYFFNLNMVNVLGYSNLISTEGILVDLTAPEPGLIVYPAKDHMETLPCRKVIPSDSPGWKRFCVGVDSRVQNHRLIIDGPGSQCVFNGPEAMTDLKFTRVNNYISVNWDGFHDNETGIRGYSWSVGREICGDTIQRHHDAHEHILDELQRTNSGQIHPIPTPLNKLLDGSYFVTVRAFNKVEYGGPLAISVCHSVPLVIDTSPPDFIEIFNVRYGDKSLVISANFTFRDVHSGMLAFDFCLGKTSRDCKMLQFHRFPYSPMVQFRFKIPDGDPAWVRIRGHNFVDLQTVGVANQPITLDSSPPKAGVVNDGLLHNVDIAFTTETDKVCANWLDFHDKESGINTYLLGAGSAPGRANILGLTRLSGRESSACLFIDDRNRLRHGQTYFAVVIALNGGSVQRNVSAVSDGVIIDVTPPEIGDVIDGRQEDFVDMSFSASKSTVGLQWRDFNDPESGIQAYSIMAYATRNGEHRILRNWTSVDPETKSISWSNIALQHNSIVKSTLRAVNGAQNSIEETTDGFLVDHTAPVLLFVGDGRELGKDSRFQADNTTLAFNIRVRDEESGMALIRYQMHEKRNGQKRQILPATKGQWQEHPFDQRQYVFTESDLGLQTGAVYTVRFGIVNNAGIVGTHETTGIIVDDTPPEILWLKVGVLSGIKENTFNGYVHQSDHDGIKVAWLATDHESGIEYVSIAVGTSPGSTDIRSWRPYSGSKNDIYISGLSLTDTDFDTMSPLYYLTVTATNGAGAMSEWKTATPIVVVPDDVTGFVYDGADVDIDYQMDIHTVTAHYDGFKSVLHGILNVDWAIGTVAGGEDVQPFTSQGIAHEEVADLQTNDLTTTGAAQLSTELHHGIVYYTTVRAITNKGTVLQSTSDGFMVDTTPPSITVKRLMETTFADEFPADNASSVYTTELDSLSAEWKLSDSEYRLDNIYDNIANTWVKVGTYSDGYDIALPTEMAMTNIYDSSLPSGHIELAKDGVPNILTVGVGNSAGLTQYTSLPAVVVDNTPPVIGTLQCPAYVPLRGSILCHWTGFKDNESPIEQFSFTLARATDENDMISVTLPATTRHFTVQSIDARHEDELFASVTAVNKVAMRTKVVSKPIIVDGTPPKAGVVVAVSQENVFGTQNEDGGISFRCSADSDCETRHVTCQESMSSVAVAISPFDDFESETIRYQAAIGTTQDGSQVLDFVDVAPDPYTNTFEIHNLRLGGMKQIYIRVKATNGVGLSTVEVSKGVYLSYLSQGYDPLSPVRVWDGNPTTTGDVDLQTWDNVIYAGWDVSGDPCPVAAIAWAVEQSDGELIQDFRPMDVSDVGGGFNDAVSLTKGATYLSLLRVTNMLNFTYTIRSNGVSVYSDPVAPGQVFDGNIQGHDLFVQSSRETASCNWNGFGVMDEDLREDVLTGSTGVGGTEEQNDKDGIAYFEVAIGTDRRFPKTRDNVVHFTNVGISTKMTFQNLHLESGSAVYYCTVRAYSMSHTMAEVTSNGFSVSSKGGVTAGTIKLKEYITSDTVIEMQWQGFLSEVDMMVYYVAVSDNDKGFDKNCKSYITGGKAVSQETEQFFNVYPVTDVGASTFRSIEGLTLNQGQLYYVWVMGIDFAGECNMTVANTTVDKTAPVQGRMTVGPYYDVLLSYTPSSRTISAKWTGFFDPESGIKSYTLSLFAASSCLEDEDYAQVGANITLGPTYTEYTLLDLNLANQLPYKVRLVVENNAGLVANAVSAPVVVDPSYPKAGDVREGTSFIGDVVWWGDTSIVFGTILHVQNPDSSACPVQRISFDHGSGWRALDLVNIQDMFGVRRHLTYSPNLVKPDFSTGNLNIKFFRDTKENQMLTGAYIRPADMEGDGIYEVSVKSSGGETVTEILFLDAPIDDLQAYSIEDYWTDTNLCNCCVLDNVTMECEMECQCSIRPGDAVDEPTNEGKQDDDWLMSDKDIAQIQACGLQIYGGNEPYAVIWCRLLNETAASSIRTPLDFNPVDEFHRYKLQFRTLREDLQESFNLALFIDGVEVSELYGVPQLTTSCHIVLHILNRNNIIAPMENVFADTTAHAVFRDLVFPPPVDALCRYGSPFSGGVTGIVRYEASIGSAPGGADIKDFVQVLTPCTPCLDACSRYSCDTGCLNDEIQAKTFQIRDLDLESLRQMSDGELKPITYYITVKAVLGSGNSVTASSNGFYVDTTPPVVDEDALMYIDESRGEFTPDIYQGSGSTIKATWRCLDEESEITEYQWAIGTGKGMGDIQPFISTMRIAFGRNEQLDGILQHNASYYVTVKCTNEAGLTTTWEYSTGVLVLLKAPDPEKVPASMSGIKDFPAAVDPPDSKMMEDPKSIGISFEVMEDPFVKRYDFCIGSSWETIDDIFPCSWVGYNVSGAVSIEDGYVTFGGEAIYSLRDLRPVGNTEGVSTDPGRFHMEPGRILCVNMRICNEAEKCAIKRIGSAVVVTSNGQIGTADGEHSLQVSLNAITSNTRERRSASIITVETTSDIAAGQSLVVNPLSDEDVSTTYASDASMVFVSYLTQPNATIGSVDRILAGRLIAIETSFTISPVGQLSLPGPMLVTFPQINTNPDPRAEDTVSMLIHWDPDTGKWNLSEQTCQGNMLNGSVNVTNGTSTIQVCNTRSTEDTEYFSKETQFAIGLGKVQVVNLPHKMATFDAPVMQEDGGTLVLNLEAEDPEDDIVKFSLESGNSTDLGEVMLSTDGILTFTPCIHCFGVVTVGVRMTDELSIVNVTSHSIVENVTIEVTPVNDAPSVFLMDNSMTSLLDADKTEEVFIFVENKNNKGVAEPPYFLFGAYDVDTTDTMEIMKSTSANGTFTIDELTPTSYTDYLACNATQCLGAVPEKDPEEMAWVLARVTYTQNTSFTGFDTVKLVIKDNNGSYSDVVTLSFVVMEMPCLHSGICLASSTYSCTDTRRVSNFDDNYECVCTHAWVGQHCEVDVDECLLSPCPLLYNCVNEPGTFKCNLMVYAVVLIAIGCAVVLTLPIVVYLKAKKGCFKKKVGTVVLNVKSAEEDKQERSSSDFLCVVGASNQRKRLKMIHPRTRTGPQAYLPTVDTESVPRYLREDSTVSLVSVSGIDTNFQDPHAHLTGPIKSTDRIASPFQAISDFDVSVPASRPPVDTESVPRFHREDSTVSLGSISGFETNFNDYLPAVDTESVPRYHREDSTVSLGSISGLEANFQDPNVRVTRPFPSTNRIASPFPTNSDFDASVPTFKASIQTEREAHFHHSGMVFHRLREHRFQSQVDDEDLRGQGDSAIWNDVEMEDMCEDDYTAETRDLPEVGFYRPSDDATN